MLTVWQLLARLSSIFLISLYNIFISSFFIGGILFFSLFPAAVDALAGGKSLAWVADYALSYRSNSEVDFSSATVTVLSNMRFLMGVETERALEGNFLGGFCGVWALLRFPNVVDLGLEGI